MARGDLLTGVGAAGMLAGVDRKRKNNIGLTPFFLSLTGVLKDGKIEGKGDCDDDYIV